MNNNTNNIQMYPNDTNKTLVFVIEKELSYRINGVLFKVHNKLGRFCNEKQYCDALAAELSKADILFEREKILDKLFAEEKSGRNRVDFLVENKIVLEVKAKDFLTKEDYFQVRRYLSALNTELGLLVNFRQKVLHPKRVLNSSAPSSNKQY